MTQRRDHAYLERHGLSGNNLLYDLRAEEEAMRKALAERASDEHTAETLVKQGALRATLIVFQQGGRMDDHQADGPLTVQVLRGDVMFRSQDRETEMHEGMMVTMEAHARHSVEALSEASILVTVAFTDD